MDEFDPYFKWLGIPPGKRPPDHYTLLGLPQFSHRIDDIVGRAHDQLARLDKYALSQDVTRRNLCQRLMNEVAQAQVTLTDEPARMRYDKQLVKELGLSSPNARSESQLMPSTSERMHPKRGVPGNLFIIKYSVISAIVIAMLVLVIGGFSPWRSSQAPDLSDGQETQRPEAMIAAEPHHVPDNVAVDATEESLARDKSRRPFARRRTIGSSVNHFVRTLSGWLGDLADTSVSAADDVLRALEKAAEQQKAIRPTPLRVRPAPDNAFEPIPDREMLLQKAYAAAMDIDDLFTRFTILHSIASIQMRNGDIFGARVTARASMRTVEEMSTPREQFFSSCALIGLAADLDMSEEASHMLQVATSLDAKEISSWDRYATLAMSAACAGDARLTIEYARSLHRSLLEPVFCLLMSKQLAAGDIAAAEETFKYRMELCGDGERGLPRWWTHNIQRYDEIKPVSAQLAAAYAKAGRYHDASFILKSRDGLQPASTGSHLCKVSSALQLLVSEKKYEVARALAKDMDRSEGSNSASNWLEQCNNMIAIMRASEQRDEGDVEGALQTLGAVSDVFERVTRQANIHVSEALQGTAVMLARLEVRKFVELLKQHHDDHRQTKTLLDMVKAQLALGDYDGAISTMSLAASLVDAQSGQNYLRDVSDLWYKLDDEVSCRAAIDKIVSASRDNVLAISGLISERASAGDKVTATRLIKQTLPMLRRMPPETLKGITFHVGVACARAAAWSDAMHVASLSDEVFKNSIIESVAEAAAEAGDLRLTIEFIEKLPNERRESARKKCREAFARAGWGIQNSVFGVASDGNSRVSVTGVPMVRHVSWSDSIYALFFRGEVQNGYYHSAFEAIDVLPTPFAKATASVVVANGMPSLSNQSVVWPSAHNVGAHDLAIVMMVNQRLQFTLEGGALRLVHVAGNKPGYLDSDILPVYINGRPWLPAWKLQDSLTVDETVPVYLNLAPGDWIVKSVEVQNQDHPRQLIPSATTMIRRSKNANGKHIFIFDNPSTKPMWIKVTLSNSARDVPMQQSVHPAAASHSRTEAKPLAEAKKEMTLDLGNGVTMKLALIPAGRFIMGSPADEANRNRNEGPQREVSISRPFYMGIYEVTQAQYQAVMGSNPSSFKGDQNPVEQVSWTDAMEFCLELSRRTGKTVRLPTEAEWEYACRAGTTTRFHTGQTLSTAQANYVGDRPYDRQKTIAVGSFKPNAFGLYDMHGNVYEWCSDWYATSYANANTVDPTGPTSGSYRVLRGGCWSNDPRVCRSASRYWLTPNARSVGLGFRVVVVAGGVD